MELEHLMQWVTPLAVKPVIFNPGVISFGYS